MRPAASEIDWLQVLLLCGVLAPLLYLATDRLAGRLLNGYIIASGELVPSSAAERKDSLELPPHPANNRILAAPQGRLLPCQQQIHRKRCGRDSHC